MKKIILVFIVAFFVTFNQAQENKFAANRADNAVSLITKNMQISGTQDSTKIIYTHTPNSQILRDT